MKSRMLRLLSFKCIYQSSSFDLDFPIECDDEYWEHPDPAKRFRQPPNKPSYVTGFVTLLKLNQVLTIILRTIVSSIYCLTCRVLSYPFSTQSINPRSCSDSWGNNGNSILSQNLIRRSTNGLTLYLTIVRPS